MANARERVVFMHQIGLDERHWGNDYKSLSAEDKAWLKENYGIKMKPQPMVVVDAKIGLKTRVRVIRNGKDVTHAVSN